MADVPPVFNLNGEFIKTPLADNDIPIAPYDDKTLNTAVGYDPTFGKTVGVTPAFAIFQTKKLPQNPQ